jgi:hypothetical protein
MSIVRSLKNPFPVPSDYSDFIKMIIWIFLYFQFISCLCNRFIIGVIRDFRLFQKSPKYDLTKVCLLTIIIILKRENNET